MSLINGRSLLVHFNTFEYRYFNFLLQMAGPNILTCLAWVFRYGSNSSSFKESFWVTAPFCTERDWHRGKKWVIRTYTYQRHCCNSKWVREVHCQVLNHMQNNRASIFHDYIKAASNNKPHPVNRTYSTRKHNATNTSVTIYITI